MLRYVLLCFCFILSSCNKQDDSKNGPKAAKITAAIKLDNGSIIHDDYAWLRDKNWPGPLKNLKIQDHIKAEEKHTEDFLGKLKENREKLYTELQSRLNPSERSEFVKTDEYYYYTRTEQRNDGKNYPIYCRKRWTLDSPEEVILDFDKIAEGKKYAAMGSFAISADHNFLAYSVDFVGNEKYTVKILNLTTKEYLQDVIPDVKGNIIWHKALNGLLYTTINKEGSVDTVLFHEIGKDYTEDKKLRIDNDKRGSYVTIEESASREFAFIYYEGQNRSSYILPLKNSDLTPKLITRPESATMSKLDHSGDYLYMLTNDTGAGRHIIRSPIADLDNHGWKEFIPVDNDKYIDSFALTDSFLILNYLEKGLPLIKILHLTDSRAKIISFPEESYVANAYTTSFIENEIRVNYSSLSTPKIIYTYDFDRGKLSILKQDDVLGGYNSTDYAVKRLLVPLYNVFIPISLIYKKSLFKQDGTNPLVLQGYGAYGVSLLPEFDSQRISLLDRGFIFAIAHVRGGGDVGFSWHDDGRLLKKKNTFNDFIACTEYLISEKYTRKGNIAINGSSAGGLLVGAVANMRPDLYKAVIANDPQVDLLDSLFDDSLLLTNLLNYQEFGDPYEKEYYEYINSYSPYENITKHDYPHIMITTGLQDVRVGYWGALKWLAKLRENQTSRSTMLVKIDHDTGHLGYEDKLKKFKDTADIYSFIFEIFKIDPYKPSHDHEEKKPE